MRRRNKKSAKYTNTIVDSLATMRGELDENVELLQPDYPDDGERQLLDRAMSWRRWCYQNGRPLTDQDVVDAKIKAVAEAAAKAAAEKAAAEMAEAALAGAEVDAAA
jgi:hypothetical protein